MLWSLLDKCPFFGLLKILAKNENLRFCRLWVPGQRPVRRYPPPGQVKPLLPYGSVPILEYKGEVICESMAIAKFLAEECGLAGMNILEGAQACEIALALNGILDAIYGVMFAKEAERPAILKKLLGETLPLKLGQLETRLTQRGGQFFAGNTVTWADLMLVMVSDNLKSPVLGAAAVLNKFPRLCNLIERINNLPNIKAFKAARPIDPMFKN